SHFTPKREPLPSAHARCGRTIAVAARRRVREEGANGAVLDHEHGQIWALVRFRHLMQAHGLARAARQHELECPGGLDDDLAGIEVERVALGACRALAAARDAVADAERIDRRRDLGAVAARQPAPALFLHLQIAADEMQAADRSARRLAAEHMAE